jgi:SAM-dependent methyltransferase
MQQDYYKEYYILERSHWWFTAREKIIVNYIKKLIRKNDLPSSKLNILNVGCGPGRTSEFLSNFGNVTSIEYDKFCCDFVKEHTDLNIINGSITELFFENNTFDLVCAFDVIEHVEDDQLAVKELKRVTKLNGLVLITVPAFMSLWSHHDVINHHFKRYKENEIDLLFKNNNDGKKLFSSYFNFILFLPIFTVRQLSNLFKLDKKRPGSGSDFETFKVGFMNQILYKIMSFESNFLNNNVKLPFGVSIIYNWKKNIQNEV